MIEIFYVEDDESIAQTVKTYFEKKGVSVTILPSVAEARQLLDRKLPACVLLDWNMPDGSGDDFCRWLRLRWPELPVIFLTVKGDCRDMISGFQNGADDYVVKPFHLDVLYSRIQALLRRTGGASKEYLSCGPISVDCLRNTVSLDSKEISLSQSEYQLLLFLLQNKGRTVTREKILQHIWDDKENYVNDNTLTVTMKRLREKLGHPECIKTVRSFGYRIEDI